MKRKEWRRFCLEILLLDAVIPQTMEAMVSVVDQISRVSICTSRCTPSPPSSRIFPGGVPPQTPPEKILGAVP
jgi:hypothetical protein